METHKIHFVDQSTLPEGLYADSLPEAKVYAELLMEVVPRKDDVVIFNGEFHTVWGVYFYVRGGIDKIVSVGYRHKEIPKEKA